MDFRALPSGPLRLTNLHAPACLLDQPGDLIRIDLSIADGQIVENGGTEVDMGGAMALPCPIDMHTHLDKGHIWPRSPNPDGTFMGALTTVGADREAAWTAEDVRARAEFSIRCAWAHGTRAIRTHLDSIAPQDEISWPVFRDLRADWAGRVDLQGVCLTSIDRVEPDSRFDRTADIVAESGGVLGVVTFPVPDLADRLEHFFGLAVARGLAADFHVDETMDPTSETLRTIAEVALAVGFEAPITVGHCCSLSVQDEARALDTLDLVAKVGIDVVSLPMCNLYLQDRHVGRTPRNRGITLVHEMVDREINVSFASDNTRDPFYAYGDMDMLEVLREATRIGHLDHTRDDWVRSITANPAQACGLPSPSLAPGASADLILLKARNWNEALSRPQSDRIVLRDGVQIDRTLPDYSDLDHLMEPS